MLSHKIDPSTGIFEIDIDGATDPGDYRKLIDDLDAAITRQGKVRILEIVHDIGWFPPSLWWEDAAWGFRHLSDIAKVAVATDSGWIGPLARMMGAVMPAEVRVFSLSEIKTARTWLAAP